MNKKEPSQSPNVMYVRLSSHFIQYLKTRYGTPVLFPTVSTLGLCVERYLVNNPTMVEITPFSYSEAAFRQKSDNGLFSINAPNLTAEQRSEFLEIIIPDEIIRPTGAVKTSNTWQLSSAGAKMFRRQAKRDFWIYFSNFYDECRYRAQRMNETTTFENITSDFLTIHGIGMNEYDKIKRSWLRIRHEIKNQIENHRALLEERTNQAFFYTA